MIVKVKRVWSANLDKYKDILDKYNAFYQDEQTALVEFKAVNELFSFKKDLNQDLLISIHEENCIEIYDDYIE